MWWLYKKTLEDNLIIRYSYSRESDELDGIIQYDIQSGIVTVLQLCITDIEAPTYGTRKAIEHFYSVISEGFPTVRKVCCG